MIIPSTTKLTFNISLAGTDVNRTQVGNLGRNIIRKLIVKLEGNEIINIDDYDILYSYYDFWKCKTERLNAVFQGIVEADSQTENAIKHWINATDKANNAKDQIVASIYDNRFCIPLDFEILESSLLLYQYGLGSHLTYELTFASYSDVIKAMDPDATYTISNISLEFDTRLNAVFQGIVEADSQTENAIKHWINATDKANNAKDQIVASIYDNRFCIPLDFEILESSLLLYQYGLGSHLTYELTFASYSDVIKAMDPDATYTISNISLEFDTIIYISYILYIMEVGDRLNPQRSYRKGFALKGLCQHIIKTNNPSTIRPDELLTVRFPDLKKIR